MAAVCGTVVARLVSLESSPVASSDACVAVRGPASYHPAWKALTKSEDVNCPSRSVRLHAILQEEARVPRIGRAVAIQVAGGVWPLDHQVVQDQGVAKVGVVLVGDANRGDERREMREKIDASGWRDEPQMRYLYLTETLRIFPSNANGF